MDLPFLALPGKNDPHFITLMRDLVGIWIVMDSEYSFGEDVAQRLYTPIMDIALFLHWWDNQRVADAI
jgi:hypothetical protein